MLCHMAAASKAATAFGAYPASNFRWQHPAQLRGVDARTVCCGLSCRFVGRCGSRYVPKRALRSQRSRRGIKLKGMIQWRPADPEGCRAAQPNCLSHSRKAVFASLISGRRLGTGY